MLGMQSRLKSRAPTEGRQLYGRIVVSTRDAGIARLVTEGGRVPVEPFQAQQTPAKLILCSYAGVSPEEIRRASLPARKLFDALLDRCAGLPLALAIAGSAVRELADCAGITTNDVWSLYVKELEHSTGFLRESQADHDSIFAMIRSSLVSVKAQLVKIGFTNHSDVDLLFSYLAVLSKQEIVPLSVLECILGMGSDETLQFCVALSRMHLVSMKEVNGVRGMSAHDVIIDYSVVTMKSIPGLKAFVHGATVDGLCKKFLLKKPLGNAEIEFRAWWGLCLGISDQGALEYCRRNLSRHMVEAGAEYISEFLQLVCDYRWTEAQMLWSKNKDDLSGIAEDLQTLLSGCVKEFGADFDEHVKRGIELLLDAIRLSSPYVAGNPRELAYQLHGRLNQNAGQNDVVDRFLWSLAMYAPAPWLKVGDGVLKAAGGPVVLNASLPNCLRCVCLLPSNENVVVGGQNGYLAVFSIRYASVLQEFSGHSGSVRCVAVCSKENTLLSGGMDGTIRTWHIGSGDEVSDPLVKHERAITSLLVTADECHILFGDKDGWLTVCDAKTGGVEFSWRGHTSSVHSLVTGSESGMVVSSSSDGTIGKWIYVNGREVGSRMMPGGGRINDIQISLDGKRIAFAADEKVGVADVLTGEILYESRTGWSAYCVTFDAGEECVVFGGGNGTTAMLTRGEFVVSDVKAHSDNVMDFVMNSDKQLLISVSDDCTLCVQVLDRIDNSSAEKPNERYTLSQFVVLPDRKRIVYSWFNGPRGLKLLSTGTAPLQAVLSYADLENVSVTVGSDSDFVTAIGASENGRYVVAGTEGGEVIVYDTDRWRKRYTFARLLRGSVWSVAVSSDSTFVAAGSDRGYVALFRVEDGSEVLLPSSANTDGKVVKVAFAKNGSSVLVLSRETSRPTGMLHVWRNIDRSAHVEHTSIQFNRVSGEGQPSLTFAMIANDTHVATKDVCETKVCVYDFAKQCYCVVTYQDVDTPELLQLSFRECQSCRTEDGLFMLPSGRTIFRDNGSGCEVLGTLEFPIFNSFRSDHWTFDSRTGLFLAGGLRGRIVRAVLVTEGGLLGDNEQEPPKLQPTRDIVSRVKTGTAGSGYRVFISHAGSDKADMALPLYRQLEARKICTFIDKEGLRPGQKAGAKMDMAMGSAEIGVFILSPEFACRRWTMKELSCFLTRIEDSEARGIEPPIVIPVFYRLTVHQCKSPTLYSESEFGALALAEGFFLPERQRDMSVETALRCLKALAGFTGIENEEVVVNDAEGVEGRMMNRMHRDRLVQRITDAVVEAQIRREDAIFCPFEEGDYGDSEVDRTTKEVVAGCGEARDGVSGNVEAQVKLGRGEGPVNADGVTNSKNAEDANNPGPRRKIFVCCTIA